MKSITKTRAVGGSLIVTIPADIARSEGLEEGVLVEIEVKKKRKDFFGALKKISPFTSEDRMKDRKI